MKSKQEPIEISSSNGNYLVGFHSDQASLLRTLHSIPDSFYVVDAQLRDPYATLLSQLPKDKTYEITADENTKTLNSIESTSAWLIERGATKSSHIVGIGGGVVQDICTFLSHIYYRGIDWTFVPTTLLSQSDSCIGAKCALNVKGHKNQIGVIHTPKAVEIFSGFLNSLPYSEVQSGYGEIAKLAVTGNKQFLADLEIQLDTFGVSLNNIDEIIRRSLLAKKEIIDVDEYESDLRRILNYGHSFGHALESLTNHAIVHGDAVIIGMELINYLGVHWGITNPEFKERMDRLFQSHFADIKIAHLISAEKWVDELRRDKKMKFGRMNFAIPVDLGEIIIVEKELDAGLVAKVGDYIIDCGRFYSA